MDVFRDRTYKKMEFNINESTGPEVDSIKQQKIYIESMYIDIHSVLKLRVEVHHYTIEMVCKQVYYTTIIYHIGKFPLFVEKG